VRIAPLRQPREQFLPGSLNQIIADASDGNEKANEEQRHEDRQDVTAQHDQFASFTTQRGTDTFRGRQ
jgi:hypothetical protein